MPAVWLHSSKCPANKHVPHLVLMMSPVVRRRAVGAAAAVPDRGAVDVLRRQRQRHGAAAKQGSARRRAASAPLCTAHWACVICVPAKVAACTNSPAHETYFTLNNTRNAKVT